MSVGKGKGKGHDAIKTVFCDKASTYFVADRYSRDKSLHKYACFIATTATGETGVVTTQQNTCMEFASSVGCKRPKCSKYHVKIGHVVDCLPCAPGAPPKLLGPLPQNLKSHHVLKGKAEWSQEQKDRFKVSFDAFKVEQCNKLREYQQEFQQQQEMEEMERVLAKAEERKDAYQQNRSLTIQGEAAVEIPSYDRIPQLSFQPNLPTMPPRSSAMHQRPAPAPASNWPQEGPSCRQNAEYKAEVTVKVEYDSNDNSDNDSDNDRKAIKELRRRRKEHKIEKARREAKEAAKAKIKASRSPSRSSGSKD